MLETTHPDTGTRWPKVDADPFVISSPSPRAAAEIAERYEHIYETASGDPTCLPWYSAGASHALIDWLHTEAPRLVRPGARTIVVGCGLGDDVLELANRGYDACGFDVSPTCIDWARRRFPDDADRFFLADVLTPPTRMLARFDLVIEAFTIQSVWPSVRDNAFAGVVSLAKPHGTVLTLARSRDDAAPLEECECAPYPLGRGELVTRMEGMGFSPVDHLDDCFDDHDPPNACLRAAFRRS
jgi:hypothetical protein